MRGSETTGTCAQAADLSQAEKGCVYIWHCAPGTQGMWCEPPSACWIFTLRLETLPAFRTYFWICTLKLEILLEPRLHLSENLTDSGEN